MSWRIIIWSILLAGASLDVTPALCQASVVQTLPVRVDLKALFRSRAERFSPGTPGFVPGSGVMVFLFLSPDCPLCRNYSLTINQLFKEYGPDTRFYGMIPGKSDPDEAVGEFVRKYHILFPLYRDPDRSVVKRLHAEVTPQAVVLDRKGRLVYSGLIDDWVVGLGAQRAHISRHYLQEALNAEKAGQLPPTERTTPIGCLINAF